MNKKQNADSAKFPKRDNLLPIKHGGLKTGKIIDNYLHFQYRGFEWQQTNNGYQKGARY